MILLEDVPVWAGGLEETVLLVSLCISLLYQPEILLFLISCLYYYRYIYYSKKPTKIV